MNGTRKFAVVAACLAALAPLDHALAQSSTWNVDTYLTPGTKWVAGYRSGPGCVGSFFPMTSAATRGGLTGEDLGATQYRNPMVLKNNGTVSTTIPNGPIAAGALVLQPADPGCATVRFVAPFTGTYSFSGQAGAINNGSGWTSPNVATVFLFKNATSLASAQLDINGQTSWSMSSGAMSLQAGDTIDIAVDQVSQDWADQWTVGLQDAVVVTGAVTGTPPTTVGNPTLPMPVGAPAPAAVPRKRLPR